MAYLHCHSCDWSQDDFWSFSYNPFTKFWSDIKWLIRPRILTLDGWIVNDLTKYTGVNVHRFRSTQKGPVKVFSWQWLWLEIVKEIKLTRDQRWWTWKSWKRDRATAKCPKCGKVDFDID